MLTNKYSTENWIWRISPFVNSGCPLLQDEHPLDFVLKDIAKQVDHALDQGHHNPTNNSCKNCLRLCACIENFEKSWKVLGLVRDFNFNCRYVSFCRNVLGCSSICLFCRLQKCRWHVGSVLKCALTCPCNWTFHGCDVNFGSGRNGLSLTTMKLLIISWTTSSAPLMSMAAVCIHVRICNLFKTDQAWYSGSLSFTEFAAGLNSRAEASLTRFYYILCK